jgi:hypothetical protein
LWIGAVDGKSQLTKRAESYIPQVERSTYKKNIVIHGEVILPRVRRHRWSGVPNLEDES